MKLKDHLGIIPEQYTGQHIETTSSISFENLQEAMSFYQEARNRLLNVNDWHKVAGFVSGQFYLISKNGEKSDRLVEEGDYLKIDIPGPGNNEGEGYDWVQVEELKEINSEEIKSTGFRVRPAKNPKGHKEETAHFYTSEATSTFIVTQIENKVVAEIIDLNLKPNDESESVTDKIRNVAVGVGAIGLFSKVQWKTLADGIVKKKNE